MPGLRERTPGIVTKEGQNCFSTYLGFKWSAPVKESLKSAPVKGCPGQRTLKRVNFIGQNKI